MPSIIFCITCHGLSEGCVGWDMLAPNVSFGVQTSTKVTVQHQSLEPNRAPYTTITTSMFSLSWVNPLNPKSPPSRPSNTSTNFVHKSFT